MRVLVVGSGGREQALAWKLAQSPHLTDLFLAPGNAGTDPGWALPRGAVRNVPLAAQDQAGLARFCAAETIDLVVIGPEVPLADGLTDALQAEGIRVFGPTRAAAEIESSKVFAKDFMIRHHLPTARYATFTDFYAAVGHLLAVEYPVVIKASGLAAGKGVLLPDCADDAEAALRSILVDLEFGSAGQQVVIEERLTGEEVSLLAFTDGETVRPMPPAQDHKRLLDQDAGPNTGGMGAYAPAPICPPELAAHLTRTILQPAVDGLRAEGRRFVGVLYAGLMLTPDGPRVLEFNCRLGDPETQALLPLLESDLLEILLACTSGRLAEVTPQWTSGAAACVVLASAGYPAQPILDREVVFSGRDTVNGLLLQAGTRRVGDRIVTAGGRVLNAVGWGTGLPEALQRAYAAAAEVHFEGMQYRRDIGHRARPETL